MTTEENGTRDTGEDVEGHYRLLDNEAADDDVEGHLRRMPLSDEAADEDTEGHMRRMPLADDAAEDDVEGHRIPYNTRVTDDEDDLRRRI